MACFKAWKLPDTSFGLTSDLPIKQRTIAERRGVWLRYGKPHETDIRDIPIMDKSYWAKRQQKTL
ncbi:unnamed protein product [Clonostachys rhizophaga]|uniref:Uncharacterized protein n=1 Tax=Clonostachys rhizophaga TaxID=160324 RepID=A0A9N9YMX2_9HYPO|nr:unnamed protein product [Clonostachys rhizophaga]